jgi:hypothetical protein
MSGLGREYTIIDRHRFREPQASPPNPKRANRTRIRGLGARKRAREYYDCQKAMKKPDLIPKLAQGQRSVVFAEKNTGILLTPQGERHVGQAQCYRVFDSEVEALAFAQTYVEQHAAVECSIRDEDGKHIIFVRKE